MKKLVKTVVSISCATALVMSMDTTAFAKTKNVQKTNIESSQEAQMESFELEFGSTVELMSTGSLSGDTPWYQNTGTSIPEGYLPDYSQYSLFDVAQIGDIVHEPNAGYGITGHSAIVEGKFFDATAQAWYLRVIEATLPGVIRSILDDSRAEDNSIKLFRVNDATDAQKQNAVNFCVGELGSSYNLDFAHDYSADETDWYCSELVWASYYNQGLDIETTSWLNEPGITPRDISRSSAVTEISYQ